MNTPLANAAAGLAGLAASAPGQRPSLARLLQAIRRHMGMDVAFISEFEHGRRVFRHVDIGDARLLIQPGDSDPLEESYCVRVVDGRLPELIPDACVNAEALTLPVTRAVPVGAHLSVPIRLSDGRIYGTFCCFSHAPDLTLTARDLQVMRVFAELAAEQIQLNLSEGEARRLAEGRIDAVLQSDQLRMVFQPIVDLDMNRVVGFESLARFSGEPYRTPDLWFSEATLVGRAAELEIKAIRLALARLNELPTDVYVTVNASPEVIVQGALADALHGQPLERIVVEVTEHQAIKRYEAIAEVIAPLQREGLRIAIDDAGAGYASFRHVLDLHPQIIKLDISITHAIDVDRSRRALAAALCGFALETGCGIVAEGVETQAELDAVRALGIGRAQGYHLGRPMSFMDAKAWTVH
ncbi:EAL domain-containing protein [Roseateles cellulosilyticus]|uniref:EAL domain-containing protein n=1 Tax=Pelomonas cellulosilytica TaxID=2906762 RepID=A0ABS8XWF5_9BURK|nr:EAL domain-containing protein [Pelomonas sp. P8]MCE4556991.1 EAL domain-containing protein [Pelomonas sp. P8]